MYKGERFNSITHLLGSIAAIVGLVVLIVTTSRQGDLLSILSATIYGTTLVMLYVFSTLNHSLRGKAKNVFQKLDFLSIYLLIAGTYTPLTLIALRGALGWFICGLVWGLAIFGIFLELLPHKENRIISLVIYLIMGWVIVIAIKPLIQTLGMAGFSWLLLGGIFYTIGVIFYVYDEQFKYFHGIWHICVLAGSTLQYFTVFYYVL
ncbi:MAG: hemolysin III [Desulforhopalus sp.]|jgi:hemolysin III